MDDIELGKLDLDAIEARCGKKGKEYISRRQIKLPQEEIIKTGSLQDLGIELDPQKGSKRKPQKMNFVEEGKQTNNI